MNKSVKWGIIAVIVLGCAALGYYSFTPKVNSD